MPAAQPLAARALHSRPAYVVGIVVGRNLAEYGAGRDVGVVEVMGPNPGLRVDKLKMPGDDGWDVRLSVRKAVCVRRVRQ